MGQNGIFRNDQANAVDVSAEQSNDRQPVKSLVIGRPVLLALEDIDGTPSFLEKALRFVEEHEMKSRGLRPLKLSCKLKIEEEAKGNALLQESLEKRKDALHVRRLALEKDVTRLQEQLQKERELRILLEAGLEGKLLASSNTDGMMKEELQEIAQAEADFIDLKQRADSSNELQQSLNNHGKSKDKLKDTETNASKTLEKSAGSKHETKLNETDSSQSPNSSVDAEMSKAPSASNRKSTCRNEGANTTSALSKLTNRLNFLKERRTQIANELEHLDKSQSDQHDKNNEKVKGSEHHHPDKVQASQSQTSEKNGADDGQSLQHPDRGTQQEGHPHLDKKSGSLPNTGKGRSFIHPRTNSR